MEHSNTTINIDNETTFLNVANDKKNDFNKQNDELIAAFQIFSPKFFIQNSNSHDEMLDENINNCSINTSILSLFSTSSTHISSNSLSSSSSSYSYNENKQDANKNDSLINLCENDSVKLIRN